MNQPEINIGTAGHVDHGKTTLLERLTGKWADTHSDEQKRGITIRLGYASTTIYHCTKCDKYGLKPRCECGGKLTSRQVSFIDAPGHESLMATMLSGSATVDVALLLIAANEGIQAQTKEHLKALQILEIKKILVIQNKIDLVSEEKAIQNFKEIKKLLENTPYNDSKIIPVSAQHGVNVDEVFKNIEKEFKTPKRDTTKKPIMVISRSFDINKPGTKLNKLKGGVLGGVIIQGLLKIDDEIVISPGYRTKDGKYHQISTTIKQLNSGKNELEVAKPGGSVGVQTELDPYLTKSDRLNGQVINIKGKEIPTLTEINGIFELMVTDKKLEINQPIMINAWTSKSLGIVTKKKQNELSLKLKIPITIEKGKKIALSTMKNQKWSLIGFMKII